MESLSTGLVTSHHCHQAISLDQLLQEMILPAASRKPLVVADLGSSLINAVETVNQIVDTLRSRFRFSTGKVPDILACFNNLPSNDFNALFKLLSSQPKEYFIAGVPGSFYGRLFPRSHVNVFVSTNTLHWLSEVPPTVMDPNSPAYNGNRWWLDGSNEAVTEEYKKQAVKDLRSFLEARAVELVPGGILYCVNESASDFSTLGPSDWLRPLSEDSETSSLTICRAMEHVWDELISEGILSETQRAAFNLPLYKRTEAEVNEVLEEYSHLFHVQKFAIVDSNLPQESRKQRLDEGVMTTKIVRSMFGTLLATHLGTELTEMIFMRFKAKFSSNKSPVGSVWLPSTAHALVLIRK